jgi:hypothetical protein
MERSIETKSNIEEAHALIELLVPVSIHRALRHDPELRKKLVTYINEQTKEVSDETL